MTEKEDILSPSKRALLVGLDTGKEDTESLICELESLAKTAGIDTFSTTVQRKSEPDPATFVGSGFLKDIADFCKNNEIEIIIFDDELTPVQQKNIEKITDVRVIDRTALILDIFAERAASHEGRLQVELARCKYSLARLVGGSTGLSRQGGAGHLRGSGESKLETDRRYVRRRISALEKRIKELDSRRTLIRERRRKNRIQTVAIVGYTNAGKSTLMNLITGHESSIITDIPGTTRDVVSEQVTLFDVPLILSDTAGLRSSCDTVEQIGVRRAREMLEGAQLIIAVFDSSKELSPEDIELLEYCSKRCCVAVINKSDLENKISKETVERYIMHTVTFSAKNAASADELGREIVKAINLRELDPDMGILFNERQLDCAKRAYSELENAISATKSGVTLDAVTVMCESSLDALLELSGERITDAVADAVFSHFCVGK